MTSRYLALGAVTLRVNGLQVAVAAARDRTVLSVLLLNAGRAVTVEDLIDATWGEGLPRSARSQVHGCIFRLRRMLPTGALRNRSPGYLIEVGEDEFDVTVFERVVAEGRAAVSQGRLAAGRQLLRQGLGLWRGPAFAAVASPLVHAEAVGLDELRLAVWEECTETELRLGLDRELVGELTSLVGRHPLREELRRQLMVALYRVGRQADALAVYRQAQADLADQLGVDPGPRLDDLYRRILQGDRTLLAAPATAATVTAAARAPAAAPDSQLPPGQITEGTVPSTAQLPVDVRGFVGRRQQLTHLDAILAAGQGPVTGAGIAVIAGTAGVGKSTLAVHWAHRQHDEFPDGQLYVNLRGFERNGMPMDPAEAVRGFLEALGTPGHRIPAGLAAQTGLYRSLLAGRQVLVVLDNAADAEQVRPLLPGSAGCLALVTSRNQLTGLLAREGAHLITLDLLDFAEARDLLAARLSTARVAAERDAINTIIACCARLPLALAVAAASAAARPDFPLAVLAGNMLDVKRSLDALDNDDATIDIRATFSCSYRTLSLDAARLFRFLALHPGPFITQDAAASMAGLPAMSAHRALAELRQAHLVTEPSPGRFSFHGLLWAYATELLLAADSADERRAGRQRMLDHYLHTAHTAAMTTDPYRSAVAVAQPHPRAHLTEIADPEDALTWFGAERQVLLAVIRQAAETGFDRHAWQIAWALTDYLFYRGDWHALGTAHSTALATATRLSEQVGMAYAHRGLAGSDTSLGRHDDARNHLVQASVEDLTALLTSAGER
jgi:DNA-binding SARP family transcriptional activator